MRVLALVPYPLDRVPGQRYRIEQWAPYMQTRDVHVTFSPFFSPRSMDVLYRPGHFLSKLSATLGGCARRLAELRRVTGVDLVFVYREVVPLGPATLEAMLVRRAPMVLDFDDAIYLRAASPANAWLSRLKRPAKTAALCRMARHVIVGNAHLANYAGQHGRQVTIVPSTIDTDRYTPRPRSPNSKPIIGWTGSVTTAVHLVAIAPALIQLRARIDFELRVIGVQIEMPGIDVRCLPWKPESEVDDLRALDLGLMPLPDDNWSRGKCAMKALQYMALGIAPVVSPVGANRAVVQDGINGLHASTREEWTDAIERLLRDHALRTRLGGEARRTVERDYSAARHAPRVAEILTQSARRRPGTAQSQSQTTA